MIGNRWNFQDINQIGNVVWDEDISTHGVPKSASVALRGTSYGIGTYLSNDIPGITPLNIVIKMVEAAPFGKDWVSTIKLSDVKGKHTGNIKSINLAKRVLGIEKLK